MTPYIHERDVLNACRTLFGPDVSVTRHFLYYLQPNGAKAAFRKRAKETHPDLFPGDREIQQQQAEHFDAVHHAYGLVKSFLSQRETPDLFQFHKKDNQPKENPCNRPAWRANESPTDFRRPILTQTYKIGSYLYAVGAINYRALIEALVWQQRQRPPLGVTACRWGWLTPDEMHRILWYRSAIGRRFGEKAVEMGLLTPTQVRTLLFFQRSNQQRLGQYFVQKGDLREEDIEALVMEMRRHNAQVPFQSGWFCNAC